MKDIIKRVSALALALCLCLSLLPAASARERKVMVSTTRDLLDLMESCVLDTYSQGLTVILVEDLVLTGESFPSIPVFCGTFEGGGHTITGFRLTGKGSDQGFFRYLKPGAAVKDLILADAEVLPEGTKSGVGLLCGQNEGIISGCDVSGSVKGDADVGGLIGVNLAGGRVENCVNRAGVEGNTRTGGLVGRNEGTIDGCTNRGGVNLTANESAQDTGGVAGLSTGSITGCQNEGDVGYKHTGYNVGGIVGRQMGNVVGCENHGAILGRKDVGGVVGQFEPYTTLSYGEDKMQRLDDELSRLSGLMTRFANQINTITGSAVEDLKVVNDAMDAIRGTTSSAGDEGRADARNTVDRLYASTQEINDALGTLLDDVDAFSGDANTQLTDMGKALDDIRSSLDKGFDAMDSDVSSMEEVLDWDLSMIEGNASDITVQIDHIGKDIGLLETFVKGTSDILSGDMDLLDKLDAVAAEAKKLESIDIKGSVQQIGSDLNSMSKTFKGLRETMKEQLGDLRGDAGKMWDGANAAADRFSGAAEDLNGTFKRFSDAATGDLNRVNDAMDDIQDLLKGYLDDLGDKSGKAVDDVDGQLQIIHDQISQMTDGAAASNSDLHDTTGDIISQLDAIRKAITDLGEVPEKTVDDVSDSVEQEGEKGRVISCQNDGPVTADANVGGLVGTVSPELSLDPEEDLDIDQEKLLADTTAYIKATVRDCRNSGTVTAKNDCAGGIVGRAEVGAVLDCLNTGDTETTSGSQCGGVAGLSKATIRRSHALCVLTGGDKVGGVAGEGHNIRDCYTMVTILGEGEQQGAIAGTADGTLAGNIFVREALAGVDGVNYAGQADALPYAKFKELPDLPEAFLGFHITFVAEGKTIKTLSVSYGGSLDEGEIPAVPERKDLHGDWADFPRSNITRSRVVEAVYRPWATAISSGEPQPTLLVEGKFAPEATLAVADWTPDDGQIPAGSRLAAGYVFGIEGGGDQTGPLTVRVRWEGGDGVQVAVLQDGKLTYVDAERDGSYLCFPAEGNTTFALLESPGPAVPWTLAVLAAAAVVLMILLLVRRGRKKKQKRAVSC